MAKRGESMIFAFLMYNIITFFYNFDRFAFHAQFQLTEIFLVTLSLG